ncbi:MAG: ABC transporter permease [Bacteroidota bacterium]
MLKTNVLMALRALAKHKGFAAINLMGLAAGLAVCLTIGLYIQHELRYDRFLPESDRVVRLIRQSEPGAAFSVNMPPKLEGELRAQIPAFAHVAPVRPERRPLLKLEQRELRAETVIQTDAGFFEVFPYPLLQGDPATALAGPNRIVLTTSIAEGLFGHENPVGQTLRYITDDGPVDLTVTGLMADPPSYTHLRFEALRTQTPLDWPGPEGGLQWNYFSQALYARLAPDADLADAEAQVVALEAATNDLDWLQDQVMKVEAAHEAHLFSEVAYDLVTTSDVQYLYFFGLIGVFILLIACINYTNLATAQAATRAREVGVRKVLGAAPRQLAGQFLIEALVLSLIAWPLAVGLSQLALPFVNRFIGAQITFGDVWSGPMLAWMLGIVVLAGLIAGSYPALYLARHRAAQVLNGPLPGRRGRPAVLRQSLVVVQFTAALVLLVGTLVVHDQLRYIQERDLGFSSSYVITASSEGLGDRHRTAKARLEAQPSVASVAFGQPLGLGTTYISRGLDETGDASVAIIEVGYDYFETMGLSMVDGQSFASAALSDTVVSVVVNEALARLLDRPGPLIGTRLQSTHPDAPEGHLLRGIVADFHHASLHDVREQPILFRFQPRGNRDLLIRLHPGSPQEALAEVEAVWTQLVPDRPLDVQFLDERIAAQYRTETRLGQIFSVFAGLAIFIACLGLFGLAAFATMARTKEIGIRKVLGATVGGLVAMLSAGFLRLVAVALLLAVPTAYLLMERWLAGFAYRTDIGPLVFVMAAGCALGVAFAAVSLHTIRAALRNPVDALRYE